MSSHPEFYKEDLIMSKIKTLINEMIGEKTGEPVNEASLKKLDEAKDSIRDLVAIIKKKYPKDSEIIRSASDASVKINSVLEVIDEIYIVPSLKRLGEVEKELEYEFNQKVKNPTEYSIKPSDILTIKRKVNDIIKVLNNARLK